MSKYHIHRSDFLRIFGLYLCALFLYVFIRFLISWNSQPISAWENDNIFQSREITVPYWNDSAQLLLESWYRWDTGWYLKIAALGYDPQDGTVIYPPLYPLLIRLVATFVDRHYLFAALIVSNIFYLLSLFLLFMVALEDGLSKTEGHQAVIYLISFPTAFFLFAAYSESLFLSLTLAAWLMVKRERWLFAGFFASLATLARLQGWILIFPLGWQVLAGYSEIPETPKNEVKRVIRDLSTAKGWRIVYSRIYSGGWAVFILPSLALIGYIFWLQESVKGSITASFKNVWNLDMVTPWQGVLEFLQRLKLGPQLITDWIDLGLFCLFLLISIVGITRYKPALSLYIWATISVIFMRGYGAQLMPGFMRYLLTLFPNFMLLAFWGRKRWVNVLFLPVFLVLQLFLVWLFLNWFWVA